LAHQPTLFGTLAVDAASNIEQGVDALKRLGYSVASRFCDLDGAFGSAFRLEG
jgi:hypothetical protein